MDSGNSGSLQLSSCGNDDFDAACGGGADSSSPLSALLRQPGFSGAGGSSLIYGLQELSAPPLSHWCSTTAALLPDGAGGASSSPPSLPCHSGPAASAGAADQTAAANEAQAQPAAPPRWTRKRARASRRAPTTVLTTDTSNFRAMVQEFTGIPAPPFAGGASAARSRLDHLFHSRSSSAASAALPQYLRPFAHNLHAYPPPFTPPSASPPAPANDAIAASTALASGDRYQKQLTTAVPSGLLGRQDHARSGNSYLSFQGVLSAQLDGGGDAAKYPLFEDRGVAPSSSAPRLQDPADFLGLAHGIMCSSEGTRAQLHPRNGDRGDELVGGCKATYSSAPPLMERNGRKQPAGRLHGDNDDDGAGGGGIGGHANARPGLMGLQ